MEEPMTPDHKKRDPKAYLLRWNPGISNFKVEDYRKAIEQGEEEYDGYMFLSWSIYDYKDARRGDFVYMMRVGDDKAGIIFRGVILEAPQEGEDWAGTERKRMYVPIQCCDMAPADGPAVLPLEELKEAMPQIDWAHGHSGELLPAEIGDRLWEMMEDKWAPTDDDEVEDDDESEDAEDEFDPDMGHGGHFQCIEPDADMLPELLEKSIQYAKPCGCAKGVKMKDEGDSSIVDLIYMQCGTGDVAIKDIVAVEKAGNFFVSAYPYVANDKTISLRLDKVLEFSNGIEAILECTHEPSGQCVTFFDTAYAIHRAKYKIGQEYDFALSAIAYIAEKVPEAEMKTEVPAETVKQWESEGMPIAPEDNDQPMLFSFAELVAYMPVSKRWPDDAEFWTKVDSRVRKATLLGREFYRMEVFLLRESQDATTIRIPIVVRCDDFPEKPKKGMSIRGKLWLQGEIPARE